MGIQGLLPFLKKIHEAVNVSQFAGCTVAIDAYCWLHKGAFSCAEKLALGEKTDQYVYYCMKFINYLLSKNIKPIMVFDGCHLPSKKNVEKARREKRELNRKKAAQFLREGRRAEARECLQRCIDISPEMALELMNVCRDKGVDCIVAPYEADAQLAYLNKCGIAQLIITEDSDLLLFGCERVLFKMDHAGNGILIEQKRLNEVMEIQSAHFTFDKFRYMCILSGCDYLPSLSGIGLVKANKVFKIARQADTKQLLKKLPTYLKTNITVPQEYIDGFIAADNTFLYQLAYDPLKRKLVPLNPYPPDVNKSEMSYAGEYMPQQKALQVALGNINIYTGELFADFDPDTFVPKYGCKKKPEMLHMLSIWDKNYRTKPRGALHERQEPDRPNLKGKEVLVKSHIKRSPRKRVREVDESLDVKTNNELSSLYSDKSPAKKKARRDDVDDHLQRFLFAEGQQNNDDQSEEEEDQLRPPPGPTRSPRFFNSLSSAHPDVKPEAGDNTEIDKENNIKSPRNKFACKSPAKKPRFNLNSTVPDVKSRFFAGSVKSENTKEHKGSSPNKLVKTSEDFSGYKPVHQNTLNMFVKNKSERTDTVQDEKRSDEDWEEVIIEEKRKPKEFCFSKQKVSDSQKSSPSPTSAFSWSKFKFTRHNSEDQLPQLNSNKNVQSQFKKVVSESNLDKFLKAKPVEKKPVEMSYTEFLSKREDCEQESNKEEASISSLESSMATSDSEVAVPKSKEESCETDSENLPLSSASVDSYPYSIDSACISQVDNLDSQTASSDSQKYLTGSRNKNLNQTSQDSKLAQDDTDIANNDQASLKGDKPIENEANKSASSNKSKLNSIYFQSGLNKNNKKDNNSCDNDGPAEIVDLIDSDDDSVNTDNDLNSSTPKCSVKSHNSTSRLPSKSATKSGCRVSGLRKGSKNKLVVNDEKQQNLRDMFSKFAHKEREVPKLKSDDCMIMNNDKFTLEGSKSTLGIKTGLQKKLL